MLSENSAATGQVTAATYSTVLQGGVMAALPLLPAEHARTLISAVSRLGLRMGVRSPVRAACLRMQHQLMSASMRGERGA